MSTKTLIRCAVFLSQYLFSELTWDTYVANYGAIIYVFTQISLYWCYMNMIVIYDDYYYFLNIKKQDFV